MCRLLLTDPRAQPFARRVPSEEPFRILGRSAHRVCLGVTKVCTASHLWLYDDFVATFVKGLEVEDLLEELPAADQVSDDLRDAGFADVPNLVRGCHGRREIEVS